MSKKFKNIVMDEQADLLSLSLAIKTALFPVKVDDLTSAFKTLREAKVGRDKFVAWFVAKMGPFQISSLKGVVLTSSVYYYLCEDAKCLELYDSLADDNADWGKMRSILDKVPEVARNDSWKYLSEFTDKTKTAIVIAKR